MDRFDCIFHIKPGFKKNILVKSFTVVYNATNINKTENMDKKNKNGHVYKNH